MIIDPTVGSCKCALLAMWEHGGKGGGGKGGGAVQAAEAGAGLQALLGLGFEAAAAVGAFEACNRNVEAARRLLLAQARMLENQATTGAPPANDKHAAARRVGRVATARADYVGTALLRDGAGARKQVRGSQSARGSQGGGVGVISSVRKAAAMGVGAFAIRSAAQAVSARMQAQSARNATTSAVAAAAVASAPGSRSPAPKSERAALLLARASERATRREGQRGTARSTPKRKRGDAQSPPRRRDGTRADPAPNQEVVSKLDEYAPRITPPAHTRAAQ